MGPCDRDDAVLWCDGMNAMGLHEVMLIGSDRCVFWVANERERVCRVHLRMRDKTDKRRFVTRGRDDTIVRRGRLSVSEFDDKREQVTVRCDSIESHRFSG